MRGLNERLTRLEKTRGMVEDDLALVRLYDRPWARTVSFPFIASAALNGNQCHVTEIHWRSANPSPIKQIAASLVLDQWEELKKRELD